MPDRYAKLPAEDIDAACRHTSEPEMRHSWPSLARPEKLSAPS